MKKTTITLIILAFSTLFTAESAEITPAYVLPNYQKGIVFFKNNTVVEAMLNYQTILKQMLFKRNEEILALGQIQNIDSVVISGRTFVNYAGEEFVEKIALDKGSMFVQYDAILIPSEKEAGFGGYSQLSNTKSVSTLSSSAGGESSFMTSLTANEKLKAKTTLYFWVKRDNKFIKATSQSQVLKAFSQHKQVIQNYLTEHKVNFESVTDMKVLLNYCFSL